MVRGWIIAAVVVSGASQTLLAQGLSEARRRPQPVAAQARRQAVRLHEDPSLRPAAAQSRRPRSPREASQQASNKSGGSFLSRFSLPSLFPKPKQVESQQDLNPPLPYDPADLEPRRQSAGASTATASDRPSAPGYRQSPGSQPRASAIEQPVSRVARSSPTPSHRRNELAEALAGLTSESEAPQAPDATAQVESEIQAPVEEQTDELPSYLRESSATAARTSAPPRASAPPHDLLDALTNVPEPKADDDSVADVADAFTASDDGLAEPPMPSASSPRRALTRSAAAPVEASAEIPPAPTTDGRRDFERPLASLSSIKSSATLPDKTTVEATTPASQAPAAPTASGTASVLFTGRQPVITSHIEGPQQVVVGRQAAYRVTIENKGDVAARDMAATIAAPAGTEIVDAAASNGTVERGASTAGGAQDVKWQLYELAPGARQTLTLQLIPRSGREMQLGVQWTHAPVVGQATVEIQEPKLQMAITGPADVLFGKSQRYALSITNPGNGAAEDVSIELTPPGGNQESMVRHKVGDLAPGETKKIELELTARQAGALKIQAAAIAAGNIRADSTKLVTCRKAELQVDWRGPDKKYAGAVATYYFRVRNPGTAPADQIAVQLKLPAGAEMVEASDGHSWDADRRAIVWKTAALNAGEERFMEVQCRMSQPGVNKLELSAQTASGDLSDVKTVPVAVEALADLKLDVVDPKGVVPVGEMAVYEIHIKNRGATAAQGVNVVAMFSEGIDPSHVEGAQHTIRDGRVSFRTFDSLAAGSETILKIHAKATTSGTHVFRAEVTCEELDVKLAAEETTRFFNDQERWADASTAYAEESQAPKAR